LPHTGRQSGADPTIASYNASAVNIYNTTNSLVCFESQNIFSLKNALAYYDNAGVAVVNSEVVGSAPGAMFFSLKVLSPNFDSLLGLIVRFGVCVSSCQQ
jgi:hypothetical protein